MRKGQVMMMAGVAVLLVALPVSLYPMYTGVRARHWERTLMREADGLRAGTRAFEVGEGDVGLLMVHGFASSPAVFQRMAPALAERGFRCRVIRLPGFGQPLGNREFDLATWRRVLAVEAGELRARTRAVWLVGHSMGATLALDHVIRGGPVEGLVLMAPLIDVAEARSVGLPPRTWFELGRRLWPERALIETAFPVDIREPMPGADEVRDLYLPVAAYGEMFDLVDRVQGRAADVTCPVLMAVAPSDLVVDSSAATAYFEALGSRDKRLLVMDGAGHVLPLDRGWPALVDAVEHFARK